MDQSAKIGFLVLLLLLCTNVPVQAQNDSDIAFVRKELVIKKNSDANAKKDQAVFVAFDYDFSDSVSIYRNNRLVHTGALPYTLPDSGSAAYPYNRRLIKIAEPNELSGKSKCKIVFWNSKCRVEFRLNRKTGYYCLEARKESPRWFLTLLNVYPWPS